MSTLKVDTIQNVAGGSASTPLQLEQGRAKAWIRFNSVTTTTITDSYNCSSVVDNGTGDTTINFTTPLNNANYCIVASSSGGSALTNFGLAVTAPYTTAATSSAIRVLTGSNTTAFDALVTSVAIFGDQ